MVLGELTQEQRLRRAELAQEVLFGGLLQESAQELTGNYIKELKNLAPENKMGRDHLISRLCVLGDVMEEITGELHRRSADGDMAIQEMKNDDG